MSKIRTRPLPRWGRIGACIAVAGAVVAPTAVWASDSFGDVDDANLFHDDIDWLVGAGVTVGCGDGSDYCPGAGVSRGQMAAFLHRLSGNDPGVAPSVNATTVDGFDATDLMDDLGDAFVETETQLTNEVFSNVSADCPEGSRAISGGYQVQATEAGAISSDWYAAADRPTTTLDGWVVSLRTLDDTAQDAFVTVYVNCAPN